MNRNYLTIWSKNANLTTNFFPISGKNGFILDYDIMEYMIHKLRGKNNQEYWEFDLVWTLVNLSIWHPNTFLIYVTLLQHWTQHPLHSVVGCRNTVKLFFGHNGVRTYTDFQLYMLKLYHNKFAKQHVRGNSQTTLASFWLSWPPLVKVVNDQKVFSQ